MAEFIRRGDPASGVVDILTNHTPELTEYNVAGIATDLKGWVSPARWVEVTLAGGMKTWPKISRPRIDIDVYAEMDYICNDILDICEASVFRARGLYRGYGVFLSDVKEEVGAFEAYDKHQETPRYIVSLRLTVTPDPGSMPTL